MTCASYELGIIPSLTLSLEVSLETMISQKPRAALHEWHKHNVRIKWI